MNKNVNWQELVPEGKFHNIYSQNVETYAGEAEEVAASFNYLIYSKTNIENRVVQTSRY